MNSKRRSFQVDGQFIFQTTADENILVASSKVEEAEKALDKAKRDWWLERRAAIIICFRKEVDDFEKKFCVKPKSIVMSSLDAYFLSAAINDEIVDLENKGIVPLNEIPRNDKNFVADGVRVTVGCNLTHSMFRMRVYEGM